MLASSWALASEEASVLLGVVAHKPRVVALAFFFVPNVQQSCNHSSCGLEPKPISYSDDVDEAVEGDLFCLASKVMVGSCRWGVVSPRLN